MNLLPCNNDLRESAKHYISSGNMVVPGVLKEVNGKKVTSLTKWKYDKYPLKTHEAVDKFFDKYKQTGPPAPEAILMNASRSRLRRPPAKCRSGG